VKNILKSFRPETLRPQILCLREVLRKIEKIFFKMRKMAQKVKNSVKIFSTS